MVADNKSIVSDWMANHEADLVRFLSIRLGNPDDARDLAQEVFLRLLRFNRIDLVRNPQAYLFRIASNLIYEHRLALNKHASSPLEPEYPDPAPDVVSVADQDSRIRRLEDVLMELSPKCRAVLIMQRRDGMSYAEIASVIGISTHMVKKYMVEGLEHCRRRINHD